jgi:hypothetical protein
MSFSVVLRNHALILLIVFARAVPLLAQDAATASVTGVLLDPSDAGVAGARIALRLNNATAATTVADASGAFRIDGVHPGNYQIVVTHEGFNPTSVKVHVGTANPAPLTIRLSLAELRNEVTVSAEATQISTNSADNLDTVTMNRQSLDDLPIFDQDYVGTMSRFLDAGSIATGGTTILVDGVEASRAGVSPSAIQEVKINNDPYSAEFPRPGRSRIEIITKPGSSAFHGTSNFLFRDYHLNARDPFALDKPPEQRRIFEGSFTGPLGRGNRTSFLISANRQEEDQQAVVFAEGLSGPIQETVPTPSRNTEISGASTG